MDSLYGDGETFFRDRFDDAILQFLTGPVGKGQAQDFRPLGLLLGYDMGYPGCQDTGLAGSAGALSKIDWDSSLTTCCCCSFKFMLFLRSVASFFIVTQSLDGGYCLTIERRILIDSHLSF